MAETDRTEPKPPPSPAEAVPAEATSSEVASSSAGSSAARGSSAAGPRALHRLGNVIPVIGLAGAMVLFVACLLVAGTGQGTGRGEVMARPGDAAPAITLSTRTGDAITLPGDAGLVTVVHFTSADAHTWRDDASHLLGLTRQFGDDPRFRLLVVVNEMTEGAGEIEANRFELSMAFARAPQKQSRVHTVYDNAGDAARAYHVESPTLFVVDQEGVIQYRGPASPIPDLPRHDETLAALLEDADPASTDEQADDEDEDDRLAIR